MWNSYEDMVGHDCDQECLDCPFADDCPNRRPEADCTHYGTLNDDQEHGCRLGESCGACDSFQQT